MTKAPGVAIEAVSADRQREVSRWWARLPKGERRWLRRSWRTDVSLTGRFVARRKRPETLAEHPHLDWYEYLVAHEIVLGDGPRYHICSAHTAARRAILDGILRTDFVCPLRRAACPMRLVLDVAPGRDLRLWAAR